MTPPAVAGTGDTAPHNLPPQATELIGREEDATRGVEELFRPEVRLLTLTGPAGTGKTRLALEIAARGLTRFPDGTFFVDVAPLTDATQLVSAIAQTLGVRLPVGEEGLDRLKDWLSDRQLLLVLDNFEQAVAAAPQLADIVAACSRLKIVVTSRAALRLRWEHEFPVFPLHLPDLEPLPTLETLARVPSVALFVERSRAVQPDFAVNVHNAAAVARLCVRLDGLPLALELAAARSKVLSPQAILGRLQGRLDLLASAARDQPARHHTLRAALDWSYELLTPEEQSVLRGLAVFAGGWSLDAAEAVCACDGVSADMVLDLLAQLVDKSFVSTEISADGNVRYRFLDTIRQYGNDAARRHGEAAESARRHAAYFDALCAQADARLPGADASLWLERLALERDNLRAALRWSAENARTEQAVRLGSTLWEAMEHVLAETEAALPAASAESVRGEASDAVSRLALSGPLSARESEVVVLLARGFTNRQIADTLVIAEGTAERHVANILNKLSLSSRAQAAVWAVEHGLLAGGTAPGTALSP